MLTITPEAADAVKKLIDDSDVPDGQGGLRIYSTPVNDQEATLNLTLVEGPEESDQVISEGDANVFLEPSAASYLDDKVLNAQFEDQAIRFAIETQPEPNA